MHVVINERILADIEVAVAAYRQKLTAKVFESANTHAGYCGGPYPAHVRAVDVQTAIESIEKETKVKEVANLLGL